MDDTHRDGNALSYTPKKAGKIWKEWKPHKTKNTTTNSGP